MLANFRWRRRLWCARLVVVLVADNGQNPAPSAFSVDSLCLPRTIRLLSARLMLGSLAFVRSASTIAHQVYPNDIVAWHIRAAETRPVRSRLDDFVAFLFHAVLETSKQVFICGRYSRRRSHSGSENAKHGGLLFVSDWAQLLNAVPILRVEGASSASGREREAQNSGSIWFSV